jgi:chromosomal replication initiation ATPase DnaA
MAGDGKTAGEGEEAPRQLTFDLPAQTNFARAEFLEAPCNRAALAHIEQWPDWPDRYMLLVGPEGAGKSHLAAIFSRRAGARLLTPDAIPSVAELSAAPETEFVLDGLLGGVDETALFHLFNLVAERRGHLLATATRVPQAEDIRLPDLLSRIRRAPVVEIGAPDVSLLRAVLEKLFRDRQIDVDPAVLDHIALRLERSLGAARLFVRAVDREALIRRAPVTKALANEMIERLAAQGA